MKHYSMHLSNLNQLCVGRRILMLASSHDRLVSIKVLRAVCHKNAIHTRKAFPRLSQLVEQINAFVSSVVLLCTPLKNKHSMCRNYGHTIDSNWKGRFPCCRDCGVEVGDSSMLRRADLTPARSDLVQI